MKVDSARKNEKLLRPVLPSAALAAAYHKRLQKLIDEMHRSIQFWVTAAYRANEPEMASDAGPIDTKLKTASQQIRKAIEKEGGPAKVLLGVMRQLGRRWQKKFNIASEQLAEYFATEMSERVDSTLRRILREAGISVKFRINKAQRDVLNAIVAENVQLIKSISQQYLGQVEGLVMRSVQTGRDIGGLTKELHARYNITKKRAAFIARQENNKATGVLTRVRQTELGITEAKWMHSHAGKTPRKSHMDFSNGKDGGPYYDVAKGMWDKEVQRFVFPGELFNCRCTSRSVLPALKPKGMAKDASFMETQHPTTQQIIPPATPTPSSAASTAPAHTSTPINTGNFKNDVKTVAKQNGLNYKIGNDTYNYYLSSKGSKLSINHKTGDWKFQTAAGDKKTGKGIETLQPAIEQMMVQEGSVSSTASKPAFATASQVKAAPVGKFEFSTHGVPLPHALPSSVKSSLKTYTGSSYTAINNSLRTGKITSEIVGKHIEEIQKAFATVPPLQTTVKVGRKLKYLGLEQMCKLAGLNSVSDLKPGHVILDKGFVSISHSPHVWSGDVKLEITVPVGGKAIHLKPISRYPNEDETLLPNNTKFKINKVESKPYPNAHIPGHPTFGKKTWTLHVEVVV